MSERHYEDLRALVWLNALGLSARHSLFEVLGAGLSPSVVLIRIQEENFLDQKQGLQKLKDYLNPGQEIEACDRRGIELISCLNPRYPSSLKTLFDPPLVLYVSGTLETSDEASVAIVGTRHPSFYGMTQAKKFSRVLAEKGLTIVSGMAQGIDQIAHEAALEIPYGRTLAVLGCGLDVPYPSGSEKLFRRISEKGAVLSEYPLGIPPHAYHFPERNRIIAGLSLAALVVEAHFRSGSLITAHQALEQGKEVFAVPGPVDQLTSKGTHRLLKEGAFLAECPEDILEGLAYRLRMMKQEGNLSSPNVLVEDLPATTSSAGIRRVLVADGFPPKACGNDRVEKGDDNEREGDDSQNGEESISEDEALILEMIHQNPMTFDEIIERSLLSSGKVVSLLTQLELNQKVRRTPEGSFSLME